ncbi:MAG: dihydroorotate dehydrogenase [Planctomycetes bacterium SM23_25]|nr:MAG: dihydroorotate dehydrogenase [Planctomycetes bacterium SM23_25]
MTQPAIDLSVTVGKIAMKNPIATASGCAGYGEELARFYDPSVLGAIVTKSITLLPREGHPPPRLAEVRAGMINAIGLANVGLETFLTKKLPALAAWDVPVIVNVAGSTREEYLEVCAALDAAAGVAGIELNVSCPNVKEGGIEFGLDPAVLSGLVEAVRGKVSRATLIVKLSPNITDIAVTARAAVDAGAEVLSLINTLRGMAIDPWTGRPALTNVIGGVSGPAIKPVALYMVRRVWEEVAGPRGVPIIGLGGIQFAEDVVEFIRAGATAVSVGTANFVDPQTGPKLVQGLREALARLGVASPLDLVGAIEKPEG